MAALGTITEIWPTQVSPRPLKLISDYDIHRGLELGAIEMIDNRQFTPALHYPLSSYIVRQIRVIFRQLWPTHGQRFPQ